MDILMKLVCLMLCIFFCKIDSYKGRCASNRFTGIDHSNWREQISTSCRHESLKLFSSTASNNDNGGPFSADFIKYQSFVRIFQLHLDAMYSKSLRIKCPFFRRRATDSVDGLASVFQFVCARHKSIPIPTLPGTQQMVISTALKQTGLSIDAIADIIKRDWKSQANIRDLTSGKGYYITGKLTREIYRDDCFFDGPDPDMPVTGLKKYISSTCQLFDHKASRADLISLEFNEDQRTVTVHWRLEGILNLPWHPILKPWTGHTTYMIDELGLIDKHVEKWDISVVDAFVSTLFPFLKYGAPPAEPILQ